MLDKNGYGESSRGGGAICFGEKAINDFLKEGKMSYIIRAHEAHSEGVALSKGAKVFTVFSTSKDHGQGQGAMCGCILVDAGRIQVIDILRATSQHVPKATHTPSTCLNVYTYMGVRTRLLIEVRSTRTSKS